MLNCNISLKKQMLAIFTLSLLLDFTNQSHADELSNDPNAMVFSEHRVIDGDTIQVTLPQLPKPLDKVYIRILGIDTPELRGKCPEERLLAKQAYQLVKNVTTNKTLIVKDYMYDKYGGRIVGKVYVGHKPNSKNKIDLAKLLIDRKLAVEYYGRGVKHSWCQ